MKLRKTVQYMGPCFYVAYLILKSGLQNVLDAESYDQFYIKCKTRWSHVLEVAQMPKGQCGRSILEDFNETK